MANPFARSTRSLQASNFQRSLVILIIVVGLIGLWAAWFFLAKVTLYEISEPIQVPYNEVIEANFSSQAQGHLQRGQAAFLKLDGHIGTEVGPIPAIVLGVDNQPEAQQVQTTLFVQWPLAPSVPAQDNLTGQVEVEIEQISPATLVIRSVSRGLGAPSVKFTPQDSYAIKPKSNS